MPIAGRTVGWLTDVLSAPVVRVRALPVHLCADRLLPIILGSTQIAFFSWFFSILFILYEAASSHRLPVDRRLTELVFLINSGVVLGQSLSGRATLPLLRQLVYKFIGRKLDTKLHYIRRFDVADLIDPAGLACA